MTLKKRYVIAILIVILAFLFFWNKSQNAKELEQQKQFELNRLKNIESEIDSLKKTIENQYLQSLVNIEAMIHDLLADTNNLLSNSDKLQQLKKLLKEREILRLMEKYLKKIATLA